MADWPFESDWRWNGFTSDDLRHASLPEYWASFKRTFDELQRHPPREASSCQIIAQRTGATASLKHCVSKQNNDKQNGRRGKTRGMNTVWRKRGTEEQQGLCVCGVPWLRRAKESPGKEKCMFIEVQLLGRQVPGHFTQHWTLARLDKWAVVKMQGAALLWKRSARWGLHQDGRPLGWRVRNMAETG